MESSTTYERSQLDIWVRGAVQGVGFRWWTRCRALELDLVGQAKNLQDGRVHVTAFGTVEHLQRFAELVTERPASEPPANAHRTWRKRPGEVVDSQLEWSSEPELLPHGFVEA